MVRSNGWRTLALVVAGVLALAGCGVSGGEHGAPGSSGGEHAAPGSSGGELSIEEARTHYEEIVAPANCTSAAFIQGAAALQASTTLADAEAALQPLASEAADASETFGSAMDAASWPDEAQPAATTVAERAHQEADAYRAVADATDDESFRAALDALQEVLDAPRPSGQMRAVLGLEGSQRVQDVAC
jgi:hypothetical protein